MLNKLIMLTYNYRIEYSLYSYNFVDTVWNAPYT